jgi:thiaminase (transcriptional activator TenA)
MSTTTTTTTTTLTVGDTTTLSARLRQLGEPHIEAWKDLPLVAAIARGDADPAVFRHYLEQDYLYITSYVKLYAKLAGAAPDEHVTHLVQLAWNLADVELGHHRQMGVDFGCDFDAAVPSETCATYISFLHGAADDFGLGLVAALPCIWGYGRLCRSLPLPSEGPYRGWVEMYRDERYGGLIDKHCAMLDAAAPDPDAARAIFEEGLGLEVAFWNQTP